MGYEIWNNRGDRIICDMKQRIWKLAWIKGKRIWRCFKTFAYGI